MARRQGSNSGSRNVVSGAFHRDLRARRSIEIELPEFLVCALEARVAAANDASSVEGRCSLNNYIETELVNLVTLRDIAELEIRMPGFADAVHQWIMDMRE